ncbi:MAG: hypothetical protein JWQ43_3104 [Glaciihabitans sp.]|nr:hypothetical protein [Glaciihabitans sp.]
MAKNDGAMPRTTITIVGHVCIDENASKGLVTRVAGSSAVYIHDQFAGRDDLDVAILAPRGKDFAEYSKDVPFLNEPCCERTLIYRNSFVDGTRLQECVASEFAAPVPLTSEVGFELGRTDILVVAPLLANFDSNYISDVVSFLPDSAVKVLLVQGYFRSIDANDRVLQREFSDVASILPHFDIAVYSNEDISDALGHAERWSAEFSGTRIVVTQNSDGATLFQDGHRVTVPAEDLGSVDDLNTIGAGDVFSAALADSYYSSRDIVAAIAHANATAGEFLLEGQNALAATA